MSNSIVSENAGKQKKYSLFHLICFSMFCFWQMGFIYFIGPSLTVDGRTPLPVSADDVTVLIAVSYIFSVAFMLTLPKLVVWAERISVLTSLIAATALFLPFSDGTLKLLIYIQVFLCCVMIGFETFIIVNYFSEENAITHLTVSYGLSLTLIAVIQNDFFSVTFPLFRIATVIALVMLAFFSFSVPANKEYLPRYIKKSDNVAKPKKLLAGTYILVFIGSLMAVSGPSISDTISHGIFITYTVDAAASIIIYLLYKRFGIHPIHMIAVCLAFGGVGFLLMFAATDLPSLAYMSCAFIGIGMIPCQMLPLFNTILMKLYPSRFLAPLTIALALIAVLVQSFVADAFKASPSMLYLFYAVVMVVLVIIYLQTEPIFLYALKKKGFEAIHSFEKNDKNNKIEEKEKEEEEIEEQKDIEEKNVLSVLSKRELEVVDLIACGYSNADIGKLLFISHHTVNDHTKNIYRKLSVHSRYELTALINKVK